MPRVELRSLDRFKTPHTLSKYMRNDTRGSWSDSIS